jgi:hypothetical protein
MTNGAVIPFTPVIFERDDLFIFALLHDLGGDFAAVADLSAVKVSDDFKGGRFAWLDVQKIDIDRVAFRDAILPTASVDDCVGHNVFSREKKPRKVSQNGWLGNLEIGCF